ncbi:FixH family protein [Sporosarcina sp. ACRSM]|uniref:FixH family protein n=1 Tax=Sporosarcina sp. ACRSM TaxID=2918216 RepID=UPI001EF3FE6A|nr:FixH family protein [Sporosarcina sp. ACRSM]MCG7335663.1 FixH family protein [Sporosarcina sp. ACRSM]
MKKLFGSVWLVVVLGILVACAEDAPTNDAADDMPVPIAVDLTVTEEAEVNAPVKMAAVVTQGDDKVEDADEVEFEVWEEGKKDDSVRIEATDEKEGLYTAETSFAYDGRFHIQVHVTARGMHSMPVKEVIVGDGGHYEEHAEEGHEHGHGHADGFSMHFVQPENVAGNEATDLVVHLELDEKPLEQARVRYEIWSEADADQRAWVEAEETKAGEYAAAHTFTEPGAYQVQIHVEDEHDLHEHETYTIEVNE